MNTISPSDVQTEMAMLKEQIANQYARREQLKQKIAAANRETRRTLWAELEEVDSVLSELDTRYKQLWDNQ